MIGADFWDEISCEWGHVELDIPADSSPETIIKALDAAVAEPVGGCIPPEEEWHLISSTIIESKLAIHCRSWQGTLGLIVVTLEEDRSDQQHKPSAANETHRGNSA